jgi:stage III sporulation protein AF
VSAWLLSILGVVIIGVLADILTPEGEMQKYIRSVFAIITVFVIISPLPSLLNKEFDLENVFNKSRIVYDSNYFENINRQYALTIEKTVKNSLEENGYAVNFIVVDYTHFVSDFNVEYINIYLSNLVIGGNPAHINKKEDILRLVQEAVKINKERIRIYE